MKRTFSYGVSCAVLLLGAWLAAPTAERAAALAATAPAPPSRAPVGNAPGAPIMIGAPRVALIATRPGTAASAMYWVHPNEPDIGDPILRFEHLAGGSVRAEVLPSTEAVLANAVATRGRDASFNGGLFRLDPATGATLLCRGLTHASRPLVTAEGRVFVVRGLAGSWPDAPGEMRVDELGIDEVELPTGRLRRVHQMAGYGLHLAGAWRGEIFAYRVAPGRTDILALDPDTATARTLLPTLAPFARDFSVDAERGVLLFRGRHPTDSRTWTIEEIDIATGRLRLRHQGPSFAMAPHAWPGGAIAFNPRQGGLRLLDGGEPLRGPLGPGADLVRDLSADGRFVAALHTEPGRFATAFVVDRRQGAVAVLPAPARERIAVAGFLPAASSTGGQP